MGYYYDWVDRRWQPIDHDCKLTVYKKRLIAERGKLIEGLVVEIERQDGITGLYAQLLARALVKKDVADAGVSGAGCQVCPEQEKLGQRRVA